MLHEVGSGKMWKCVIMRGGGAIFWASKLSTAEKMHVKGRGMYVEVGINIWRAGDKVLSVSAPVWGGWGVVTYLHP